MKYIILIFSFTCLIWSCGQEGASTEMENPTDLKGKKAMLSKKKKELKELKKSIDELKSEINKLSGKVEKSKRLVTTQLVEKTDFKKFVEIQATVQADDVVSASSEVGGRILNMNSKEGDYVSKGAVIASVDLESITKQVAELEKSLELATDIYERQSRLWAQKIGSEVQYLQAKNNKERIEKSIESVQFNISKSNVYAPISGYVDRVIAKSGEMAAPGMPIIQILNTSRVKIVADVPETYLSSVKKGALVNIRFPALDIEKNARVTLLGRSINPANRTFKVEVDMKNSKGVLKPNLLAMMMINDYAEKNVITIPIELVQQEVTGKDFVYIKKDMLEGAAAQKIYVETGESYEGNIVITSGLSGGEELIMDGSRTVTENELLEIQETTKENNG